MTAIQTTKRNQVIEQGHKFALLALPIRNLADSMKSLHLLHGLEFTRQCPLSVSEQWRRWIGELGEKAVSEAGSYLMLSRASKQPEVLDGENQELMQDVCFFWDALLMVDMPCCGEPQLLSGANIGGEIKVRSLQKLRTSVRRAFNQGAILHRLTPSDLERADTICGSLRTVVRGSSHQRFKWALTAFFDGVHESRYDRRLHQFCRCIDGIICSRKGSGKRDFEDRTALFIGAGREDMIGEIYLMRSAVEHLRPATTEATSCSDESSRRKRVIVRSVQAEVVARHCVTRILSSACLLNHYATDDTINAFWALPAVDRTGAWGGGLDFDADLCRVVDPTLIPDRELQ